MGTDVKPIMRSTRLLVSSLGLAAWIISVASAIFAFLDAVVLVTARISFRALSVGAAVFDVVVLLCLFVFVIRCVWRQDPFWSKTQSRSRSFVTASVLLGLTSLALTVLTNTLIRERFDRRVTSLREEWIDQTTAKIVLAALAFAAQLTFYASSLFIPNAPPDCGLVTTEVPRPVRDSVISKPEQPAHTALQILPSSYGRGPSLPSPTYSTVSSHSIKSWRSSLHQVVRPVTSRTRLLIRHASFPRDSKQFPYPAARTSSDSASCTDGFDTWDTSSVDPQNRDAVMQSVPYQRTALDPIPGSRPVSPAPALALDGPFFPPRSLSGRHSPALSNHSQVFSAHPRAATPDLDEANIHPLFRTDSPVPPPAATPGTVVVASPFSGQVIQCPTRPASRMRSNSRLTTPSPLIHSQSFVRESSRSPSPPPRVMTPPIPDSPRIPHFPEGSLRKLSLHSTAGS